MIFLRHFKIFAPEWIAFAPEWIAFAPNGSSENGMLWYGMVFLQKQKFQFFYKIYFGMLSCCITPAAYGMGTLLEFNADHTLLEFNADHTLFEISIHFGI